MKRVIRIGLCAIVFFANIATAQQGEWELPVLDFGDTNAPPIAAVHLIHTFDGTTPKVVAVAQTLESGCLVSVGRTYLWIPPIGGSPGDPGTFANIPDCRNDRFCSGHVKLANGRVFVNSGAWP